jgi:hypothetical protein
MWPGAVTLGGLFLVYFLMSTVAFFDECLKVLILTH